MTQGIRASRRIMLGGIVAAAATFALGAHAQAAYPTKPIRVIVPFPAGAGTDGIARIVTQHVTETQKWTFVIENRPGAGGNLGVDQAVKAPADGYTIVLGQTSNLAVNPTLYTRLPYDPRKDLAPIVTVASSPIVVAVASNSRFQSFQELVAAVRAKPEEVTMGYPGNGTVSHLTGELIQKAIGSKMRNVPYKGAAQAMNDLIGGQIDIYLGSVSALVGHVRTGKVRALGVTSSQRAMQLPETPTLSEAGLKGFEAVTWFGFAAPAGTPAAVISTLNAEFNKALQNPAVAAKLKSEGGDVMGGTPEQFRALIASEIPRWGEVVKASGATID